MDTRGLPRVVRLGRVMSEAYDVRIPKAPPSEPPSSVRERRSLCGSHPHAHKSRQSPASVARSGVRRYTMTQRIPLRNAAWPASRQSRTPTRSARGAHDSIHAVRVTTTHCRRLQSTRYPHYPIRRCYDTCVGPTDATINVTTMCVAQCLPRHKLSSRIYDTRDTPTVLREVNFPLLRHWS